MFLSGQWCDCCDDCWRCSNVEISAALIPWLMLLFDVGLFSLIDDVRRNLQLNMEKENLVKICLKCFNMFKLLLSPESDVAHIYLHFTQYLTDCEMSQSISSTIGDITRRKKNFVCVFNAWQTMINWSRKSFFCHSTRSIFLSVDGTWLNEKKKSSPNRSTSS